MFSGRGLCDELITRPEESYRLCCVVVCDLETSRIGAPYIYDISNLRVNLHIHRCETSDLLYFLSISISGSHDRKQMLFADPTLQPAAVVVHEGRQIPKYT